jgi:folate-binding protein YgfZ
MNDRNRLRWRCRRGVRELDLVLQGFLDARYDLLSIEDRRAFDLLLDQQDPDLLAWLVGNCVPQEKDMQRLIAEIRTTLPSAIGVPAGERAQALRGNIIADLSHYGLIEVAGKDAGAFLAAQFTSDIPKVSDKLSQLSAWCTPKGRVLAVFRVFRRSSAYYLMLPMALLEAIVRRLRMYILRSEVTVNDASSLLARTGLAGSDLASRLGETFIELPAEPHACVQQENHTVLRVPGFPPRFIVINETEAARKLWLDLQRHVTPVGAGAWALLDIMAGIPIITPKISEQFLPQMLNLEALGGLSFTKGCYPGQEVITRLKYRGQLKRRLYLGLAETDHIPQPGDDLFCQGSGETQNVGKVVSAELHPDGGVALLAVIEISATDQGHLRLYAPVGPAVMLQPLPYFLEDNS